jgi:RHS repeat-associated protein
MKDVNADPGDNGYAGGAWEFYFYGITGQKLMTLNCSTTNCWLGGYNVHFGGKLVASQYRYPVVTDRLGSVRYSGGVSRSYFPYGEERTVTLDDTEKFGTYLRDGPGQDYAEQRYYNNGTGRFWNVDPGGIKTARPSNPASLNRYAYVHDDPVNHTDRRGLYLDAQDCINDPEECEAEDWCDPDGFYLVEQPGCDAGGGSGPVSVAPPPPPPPKCWTQTGKIDATLNNLGTDIEADVANQFSSADKSLLTADIIWDISLEMSAIGPGTTSSPYYIGGHFNLNIFGSQIADFSPADQRYFYDDFAGKGAGTDGVRQAASTGLAAALGYTLHSQLQKNDPGIQQGEYSFHFDRFNPNNGLAGGIGHGVWDGLYGTLFHPCLDPAWHQ